jgi:hypothetical protein
VNRFLWPVLVLSSALALAACGDDSSPTGPAPPTSDTAPIVLSTYPADSATMIARNVSVTATFDEAMLASSIDATTFLLRRGATSIAATVSYAANTATLIPTNALEPNTMYEATISTGVKNAAGVSLEAVESWDFTIVNSSLSGPQAVNLGTSGGYAILAKSAISTTGTTSVLGDLGLSPSSASFITGFSLSAPPTSSSTSPLVTGLVWAADYDAPTPANLTTAVLDMQNAYTDAAGRVLPDFTELGAGNIDGLTLVPGLYKWGTGISFATGVTLEGGADDIWIFQIAEDLTVGNGAILTLSGGAQAKNIFWQVAGATTLGTTASFKGIILCQTLIALNTGATVTGRLLAQTAVTLDASEIINP